MLPKPEEGSGCRRGTGGRRKTGEVARKGGKRGRRSRQPQGSSTAHSREGACSAPAPCFWSASGLFFSSSDMEASFFHRTPSPSSMLLSLSSPFLFFFLPATFTIFPSCFAHTFLHSLLVSSSHIASPSLSPSILLTLSTLQLPQELSNDLNETPDAFIFNSPPCRIPKGTQPGTAIRKPVPGAAAFAMSAWRSSLPSPRRGGGLHKVASTASTGAKATAEPQEGFSKPARFLRLSFCPPLGCQHVSAHQQHGAFHVLHGTYSPSEPSLGANPRAGNMQQLQCTPGWAGSGWGTISGHIKPSFKLHTK